MYLHNFERFSETEDNYDRIKISKISKKSKITENFTEVSKTDFKKIEGKLKFISATGKGVVWGTDDKNKIKRCDKPCKGRWRIDRGRVSRREKIDLKQISGGDEYVWGIDPDNNLYKKRVTS